MTGKYLVGAAGMAVGALLTLMVGSWTTSAQETSETAVSYRDAGEVRSLSVVRPVSATRSVAARSVATVAPVRRTATAAAVPTEPKRSWKKTALVIGGSAGAGAGVGAIAGGKKGALIGAAIGGGAASLFEALKRK